MDNDFNPLKRPDCKREAFFSKEKFDGVLLSERKRNKKLRASTLRNSSDRTAIQTVGSPDSSRKI